MAKIAITPQIQFLNDSGNPLAAGKVYTYEAGTTTPLASYIDANETTQNSNPVILDSAGRANIWLGTTTRYKIVVKDSDDNTIYTVDDVDGAGGSISQITTAGANLDMNGYSIVTNANKDLILNPNGTGTTNIYRAEMQTNADMNGFNLAMSDATGIVDDSDNEILQFGVTASAVNYLKSSNAATGNDPIIEAKGDDTNVGIVLTPKGSGTINVPAGTYESNISADDDLVNKKYVDDTLAGDFASSAEVTAETVTNKLISPATLQHSERTVNTWATVQYNTGTPSLVDSFNVTSLTDTSTGNCGVNVTNNPASSDPPVFSSPIGNSIDVITIGSYSSGTATINQHDISSAGAVDNDFCMCIVGAS